MSYAWTPGNSQGRYLYVNETNRYSVTGTTKDGCESFDEVTVVVNDLPEVDLGEDTMEICSLTELDAGGNIEFYTWSTGDISQRIEVNEPESDSLVWVKVEDEYGCVAYDSVYLVNCFDPIKIPSAFTPNPPSGDGTNDLWVIEGIERFEKAEIRVFNRKKVLVFESIGPYEPWDGRGGNGKVLPIDSYHYIIDLKDPDVPVKQGFVTIVY